MRISSLAASVFALALASESAQAGFVMEIDDPNTALAPDLRIEDNGPGDGNPTLGLIEFLGYVGEFGGGVAAFGKDFVGALSPLAAGSPADPDLLMEISLFRSVTGGSLDIRVTDTGFDSGLAAGEAFVDVAIIGGGADGIQFDFFGDSGDQEFGRSFDIGTSEFFEAPIDAGPITVGPAPADPVGSLTMSASIYGFGSGEVNFAYVTALKLLDDFEPTPSATPMPTPTPTATPTATPTPTPTASPKLESECQCVPHRIVPGGNLAALNKTNSRGRGLKRAKKVGVILKARERTRGACRFGSNADTFSLRLRMEDDDGGIILDKTRTGLKCERRISQEKFMATYRVENCAGSIAPDRRSRGEVTLTATTEYGELIARRTLACKK
jgi:hypothetical protein